MDAKDRRIAQFERELAEVKAFFQAALAERDAEIAQLKAQLKKDSSTSSKPPSSDIVKPPKSKDKDRRTKRKIGAQPGHKQNLRKPIAPEWVDVIFAVAHGLSPPSLLPTATPK